MRTESWRVCVYARGEGGGDKKRRPKKRIADAILARQNNLCLYCDIPFGATVTRRGRAINVRLNWDHFVPYAYSRLNPWDNWVAACHICNAIKGCSIFGSVQEVRAYVAKRRADKGYELTPVLLAAASEAAAGGAA